MNKQKQQSGIDIIDATEALRRNLRYQMMKSLGERSERLDRIIESQFEKAEAGDTKAARFVSDMLDEPASSRPTSINVNNAVVMTDQATIALIEIRKRIVYMIADNGPMDVSSLAARIAAPPDILMKALHPCEWFELRDQRCHMTSQARRDVLETPVRLIAESGDIS